MDVREEEERRGKPIEDLVSISIYSEELDKFTYVGALLPEDLISEFVRFPRNNHDVFSWIAADMLGIDPFFMAHKLNVNIKRKAVKPNKRNFTPKRLISY